MSSVITVTVDELKSLLAAVIEPAATENKRMRAKLLELAHECAECDGCGLVTVKQSLDAVDAGHLSDAPQPCPVCHDIRELL